VLAKIARNEKKILPLIAGTILTLAGFRQCDEYQAFAVV
jgi:hypothetical protein